MLALRPRAARAPLASHGAHDRARVVASRGCPRAPSTRANAKVDDDDDFAKRRAFDVSSELEADIARYAERQAREVSSSGGASNAPASSAAVSAMDGVKEAIDTFLLYDFFVILFILAWLVLGVGVRLSAGNGLSYDEPFLGTWLFLWPWLFQPLLGVHMLATLVSPAIGFAKKKGLVSEDTWQ